MKPNRILLQNILIITSLSTLISCADKGQNNYGTYEAESGSFSNMRLLTDPEASGGKYLAIQENSKVTWDVSVPHPSYYQLNIRYRATGGDKMQYLLKNGDEIGIGFDMSGDWNICSQPFFLDSGINILGIRDGWGNMDIDRISINKAGTEATITPMRNRIYLDHDRDLVFKIDNYNQRVLKCRLDGKEVIFEQIPYPYQEYASWLRIPSGVFAGLSPDEYVLDVKLESEELSTHIELLKEPEKSDMIVVAPDVEHGAAMLLKLPGGSDMLIDCGKSWVRDSILVPMLIRHGIDTITTFIMTHYHPDHDGGDSGQVIKERFHVQEFIDYHTFPTGYEWEQEGVHFKVLNSYADGTDENTRSLSLSIRFNDFHMVHGGDTYGVNQQMILERFPEEVPADVFYANHHFHGSVNPEYILQTNPDLVILQAQEAIYARAAYMVKYKKESEQVLDRQRIEPVETLPALEVGTIVLRIDSAGDWCYETYRDQDEAVIPL